MVKALHRAGIEVILDVVFNHTAEGDDTVRRVFPRLSRTGLTTCEDRNLGTKLYRLWQYVERESSWLSAG